MYEHDEEEAMKKGMGTTYLHIKHSESRWVCIVNESQTLVCSEVPVRDLQTEPINVWEKRTPNAVKLKPCYSCTITLLCYFIMMFLNNLLCYFILILF